MTAQNTSWNAEVYDRIGTPMRGWAQAVIDDLQLQGDEVVLDAGCGAGKVTLDLFEKLPNGRIYALDHSSEMIEKIRAVVEERGIDRIIVMQADLSDFALPEQVNVVFSNSTLHWIHNDDGLFGSLFRATKPGGRLRAQCGGGHIFAKLMPATDAVRAREPFAEHFAGTDDTKNYRTVDGAVRAMERNGWADARARVFDAPVQFPDEDAAALYLRTIILRDHVRHLPEGLQDMFVRAVVSEYVDRHGPPFTADYVRLDLWATKPL